MKKRDYKKEISQMAVCMFKKKIWIQSQFKNNGMPTAH